MLIKPIGLAFRLTSLCLSVNLKWMQKHKGFTLFELLVSISIIGLLVAVSTVSFGNMQKKGRDAKRREDMQVVQKGFEQYYSQHNYTYDSNTTCGTMLADTTLFPGGVPTDPKNNAVYFYTFGCTSSTTYCVCALLEQTGSGNASNNSCTFATGGNYFCVQNVQ